MDLTDETTPPWCFVIGGQHRFQQSELWSNTVLAAEVQHIGCFHDGEGELWF